jgi:cytochrome c biogenesis protein
VEGVIGGSSQPERASDALTLEYTGLRTINVENFGDQGGGGRRCAQGRPAAIAVAPGRANKTVTKELRNVGPSMSYKLRDASGQAREYHNYMLPVDMGDGVPVFLLGVREARPSPSATCACRPTTRAAWTASCACAGAADPAAREGGARYVAQAVDAARAGRAAGAVGRRALAVCRRPTKAAAAAGGLQAISNSWKPTCPRPSASAPARC